MWMKFLNIPDENVPRTIRSLRNLWTCSSRESEENANPEEMDDDSEVPLSFAVAVNSLEDRLRRRIWEVIEQN